MGRILIICGPTATGKTSLALDLAKKFNGEIISADSRQVYTGLDIGTGKDVNPTQKSKLKNQKYISYIVNDTTIWGYDLVDPKEEFSVAQYTKIAKEIIDDIYSRGRTPILVGGTGFYIKSLIDGVDTLEIPKDQNLRDKLSSKKVSELYDLLVQTDYKKAVSLNESDKKNPRRLIRAIEVACWNLEFRNSNLENKRTEYNPLFIGLNLSQESLYDRIQKRVLNRINNGFEEEVYELQKNGFSLDLQSANTLGYSQWLSYINGEISREKAIADWMHEEQLYSKRQLTWFKKDKRINWFDVEDSDFISEVEDTIRKWHNSSSKL